MTYDGRFTIGGSGRHLTLVVGVTGIDEAARKLDGLDRNLRNKWMLTAMRESMKVYRAGLIARTASMRKTGRLQRSIRRRAKKIGDRGDVEGRVSIGNKVDGVWAFYAQWLEVGSGVYGRRGKPYRVTPKGAQAIMWPGAPHPFARALIMGVRGRHFTEATAKGETPKAIDRFGATIDSEVMTYWNETASSA